MLRHLVIAAVVLVAVVAPLAGWAADMEGKLQSVNAADRTVVLDNGTKIWLSDAVVIDSLKEGSEVKVSYEEKDGKPVASMIEVK
jgi:hypothetical protein